MGTLLKILFSPLFFFMQWLAEEDILFTTVKEGTAKAIMRGKSFERFIMRFSGYHLNDPTKDWYRPTLGEGDTFRIVPEWEVLYHGKENKNGFNSKEQQRDEYYDDRPWILKHLGLYWVGWPWANSVYVYQFEWSETHPEQKTGKEEISPRSEWSDFVFVADFTYAVMTAGAETKDRIPTDILTLVTVAVRNPYRTLFSGVDWMQRVTSAINRHVRTFVTTKDFDEFISISKGGMNEATKLWTIEFSDPIKRLTEFLADENEKTISPRGLKERYGVVIRTGDLQTIEFSGTEDAKKKLTEAATLVYLANQKATEKQIGATADAGAIRTVAASQADALTQRLAAIEKYGDTGKLLAQLDALEKASAHPSNTIVWANNPLISALAVQSKEDAKKGETKP
ncbi:MAG: hypothetical protein Q7T37_00325 [bacterium]|nr:hypothetical protein [bacterium]MDO8742517.1 hypothetical protein [bacterium]